MSVRHIPSFFATLAVAFLFAVSANAAVLITTYIGTVGLNASDVTGEFGAPASDLTGLPFVATFTYDTSLGDRQLSPGVGDGVQGGPALGFSNPHLDSTLTIKGVTAHFNADNYSQFIVGTNFIQAVVRGFLPSTAMGPNNFSRLELSAGTPGTPPDINFTFGPVNARGSGYFEIRSLDDVGGTGARQFASGNLVVTSVAVRSAVADAVPEPTSWALMIVGLGAVGFAARRGRTLRPARV